MSYLSLQDQGASARSNFGPSWENMRGNIWVRSGHEVTQATPAHFPILLCQASDVNVDAVPAELGGSLPPSAATLKRFIGRIKVIEDLFNWLQNSDEPRTYLYGKGGSGKSTIAYEFATLLKSFGSEIALTGHDKPDAVLFLSAKEKMLQTHGGPTIAEIEPDFHNEWELFAKILYYGHWILDEETIAQLDSAALRKELKAFFDYASVVVFIDDIDTLTNKGIDPGSDYIYRLLCRAKRTVKRYLYTAECAIPISDRFDRGSWPLWVRLC